MYWCVVSLRVQLSPRSAVICGSTLRQVIKNIPRAVIMRRIIKQDTPKFAPTASAL